jgi:hypothetical protein
LDEIVELAEPIGSGTNKPPTKVKLSTPPPEKGKGTQGYNKQSKRDWKLDKPSQKQMKMLECLGITAIPKIKGEAADLIKSALANSTAKVVVETKSDRERCGCGLYVGRGVGECPIMLDTY